MESEEVRWKVMEYQRKHCSVLQLLYRLCGDNLGPDE